MILPSPYNLYKLPKILDFFKLAPFDETDSPHLTIKVEVLHLNLLKGCRDVNPFDTAQAVETSK